MKIDLHLHTRKSKKGDPLSREVSADDFCSKIVQANVDICAITNHNLFDIEQYKEILEKSKSEFIVWPGVELDINDNEKPGHIIVICNPKNVEIFNETLLLLQGDKTADEFKTNVVEIANKFDGLDVIYLAHYLGKGPVVSDEIIERLEDNISNKRRIFKEASNAISAGIFLNHGHRSLNGTDIHDWSDYINKSADLPELRLPVDSFEKFCLLIDKDEAVINTLLHNKYRENLNLTPFKNSDDEVKLNIYNDINVLFGSKGTGKTDILNAISLHYNNNGLKTSVYETSKLSLFQKYGVGDKKLNADELVFDRDECIDEINNIKKLKDAKVESINNYLEYIKNNRRSATAKLIKIDQIKIEDNSIVQKNFESSSKLEKSFTNFLEMINEDKSIDNILPKENIKDLKIILSESIKHIKLSKIDRFQKTTEIRLLNHIIKSFSDLIIKKQGGSTKPMKTGFIDFAKKRINLKINTEKVISELEKQIKPKAVFVGDLGKKGKLFCKTIFKFQNGSVSDVEINHWNSRYKEHQKKIANKIKKIHASIYTEELFEEIEQLNKIERIEDVNKISDFILFKKVFQIDHKDYTPSNGESAMIQLKQVLTKDEDVYLIDEPEKSLGNDYINDEIVPILKGLSNSNKRVIIATHDANLAVRTLPYNSIYREHSLTDYKTYEGNPFTDNLKNIFDESDVKSWKISSLKTLEGGEAAFGERGDIYGK